MKSGSTKIILPKILFMKLVGRFFKVAPKNNLKLPKLIGNYKFIEKVKYNQFNKFQLGIYQNSKGEKAIAKQIYKSVDNLNFYWLQNEIAVYEELNKLYNNKGKTIKKHFPNINIPKLISVDEDKHQLIMLIEMIDGKHLTAVTPQKSIAIYDELFEYFKYVGKLLDKKKMSARGLNYFLAMYPILIIKSFIKHPEARPLIINSAKTFIKSTPNFLKNNQLSFVHRDLNQLNVFLAGDQVWLIDFEQAILTNPLVEVVHVLMRSWDNKNFKDKFINSQVMKKITKNSETLQVYKSLALYSALFALTLTDKSKSKDAYSFLNYATKL